MGLLRYLYQQSWRLLTWATLAGLLCGVSSALLAMTISRGLLGQPAPVPLAPAFFLLCLVCLASKTASEKALIHLTQTAVYTMRLHLSQRVLATPQKQLQALGKHGVMVILTRDVEVFTFAFEYLPIAFNNGVIIVCCMAFLAYVSMPMFLLLTVLLGAGIAGFHWAEREPIRQLAMARDQVDLLYEHFRNLIEGSRELQMNRSRGRRFVDKVLQPDAADFCRLSIASLGRYMSVTNVGGMSFYLVLGVMLFLVPRWLPQSPAVLTSVTMVLLYLIKPISELLTALPRVRQAAIALDRIQQLADALEPPAPPALPVADPFGPTGRALLEVSGLTHRYPGEQRDESFCLGPVDLTVRPGETLFVIGGNGGGKTTLAMLLLGLYVPDAGNLRLNGVEVTDDNRDAYRQRFSAIFSDFHLFEQLLMADDGGLTERAGHYVSRLGMADKVKVAEGRFSTVKLSQGQRKRLALVSAYLEDRPICLFDEWAADQDPRSKQVFYTELLPELKARGKAVIVITHDDAYFGYADRIVKLADGRLLPVDLPSPNPVQKDPMWALEP